MKGCLNGSNVLNCLDRVSEHLMQPVKTLFWASLYPSPRYLVQRRCNYGLSIVAWYTTFIQSGKAKGKDTSAIAT